jgi:hypothetical protein
LTYFTFSVSNLTTSKISSHFMNQVIEYKLSVLFYFPLWVSNYKTKFSFTNLWTLCVKYLKLVNVCVVTLTEILRRKETHFIFPPFLSDFKILKMRNSEKYYMFFIRFRAHVFRVNFFSFLIGFQVLIPSESDVKCWGMHGLLGIICVLPFKKKACKKFPVYVLVCAYVSVRTISQAQLFSYV